MCWPKPPVVWQRLRRYTRDFQMSLRWATGCLPTVGRWHPTIVPIFTIHQQRFALYYSGAWCVTRTGDRQPAATIRLVPCRSVLRYGIFRFCGLVVDVVVAVSIEDGGSGVVFVRRILKARRTPPPEAELCPCRRSLSTMSPPMTAPPGPPHPLRSYLSAPRSFIWINNQFSLNYFYPKHRQSTGVVQVTFRPY